MEHRKFQQRLDELLAEVTHAQAQKAIAALRERGDGDEVQRLLNERLEADPRCPHCGSGRTEGWGRERNGLKRCRCLDCKRTFNPLTGTPLARLRKKECWLNMPGRSMTRSRCATPGRCAKSARTRPSNGATVSWRP